MSQVYSPNKLAKKQSLSILAASTLNQINNTHIDTARPLKDRIISESTGLIKFSLRKISDTVESATSSSELSNEQDSENTSVDSLTESQNQENIKAKNTGLPIYVPINDNNQMNSNNSDEILFEMATRQRKILELKAQLAQTENELKLLEKKYKQRMVKNSASLQNTEAIEENNSSSFSGSQVLHGKASVLEIGSNLRQNTSLININTLNANEAQQNITKTISQITTNISNSNILNRGKNFFETFSKENEKWINKNIKLGSEFLNNIIENQKKEDLDTETDDDDLIEESNNFEYSVDFDLNRLNKLAFRKKIKGTFLDHLDESVDDNNSEHDTTVHESTAIHDDIFEGDIEDYGGEAVSVHQA